MNSECRKNGEAFELNNLERSYLGLDPVGKDWEKVWLNKNIVLFFDGDIIRKMVSYGPYVDYEECDLYERTTENRSMLLPKTSRGKVKKLCGSAAGSFRGKGVYFSFSKLTGSVIIGNFTTQTTFFTEDLDSQSDIRVWLDKWIAETSPKNLEDLMKFKAGKRQHVKYNEGDFFTFRIGRDKCGFGRILLNVSERRKSEVFRMINPGLCKLLGKPLVIKIYRTISDNPDADIDRLRQCDTLQVQPIMDNRFYYGEYSIIGNCKVEHWEWDGYKSRIFGISPKISRNGIGFGIRNYSNLYKLITSESHDDGNGCF